MNDPTRDPDYLKIGEAALLLGVTRRTIYRRVWSGDLPASKVGGLYFIRRSDLESLLSKGSPLPEEPESGAAVLKCGACYRLLLSDQQIASVCQADGCEALICTRCQEEGVHFCAQHTPSQSELWEDALARYERGEISVLTAAASARARELNFTNRIQSRISQIQTLLHPVTGEALNIASWDALLETGDDRADVLELLNRAVLDADQAAQTPLNSWQVYRIPARRGSSAPMLEIEIRVLSHLPEMLHQGFDTQPFDGQELLPWLIRSSEEAQRSGVFRIIVLAATTGWDASAREIIQGQKGKRGSAFTHRLAHFYLFDLEQNELVFQTDDEHTFRYAELFNILSPSEEIEEIIQFITKSRSMLMYGSLSLSEIRQAQPYSYERIRQAFDRLVSTGNYETIHLADQDLAIVQKRS